MHLVFEGYFSWHHQHMPGRVDLFGESWKEYAKADSRYLTIDPLVVVVESITAVP